MATYRLGCMVGVSAYTDVEADSLEEAVAIAEQREVVLAGSGGEDPSEQWVIDDADGTPTEIHGS